MRGIEWVRLSTGTRAVPQPVATPLVWFAAFSSALLLVAITNGLVGHGHPNTALIGLSLLSALLGLHARITAAPGTALLCWLHLNGFAIPPAGQLTWAEHRDTTWLACLLGAAVAGTVVARVVNARAAYRRLT
ncbi:hypothetical protein AB0912_24020 [Streptomyces sp. NPDC007084]|uniref:hypothetical protein n=1 Tax=Streptomyces sp. NPDC007084 TaxID=3154313 RepID=UPI00345403CE